MAFVPVNDAEEVKDGHSYVNVKEVEKIVVTLLTLIRTGGLENGVNDVGVITPYSSQVRLIKAHTQRAQSFKGRRPPPS